MKRLDLAKATRRQVESRIGKGLSLILRTCDPGLLSHGDFKWPEGGFVAAPDWSPRKECGFGLHGLLNGHGDADLMSWDANAVWLVAAIEDKQTVDLGGKVKAPRAWVLVSGSRKAATDYLAKFVGAGIHGVTLAVADKQGATGGRSAVIAAGDSGQATAGDSGQATAGDSGQATAGHRGQATAGHCGQATAGHRGQARCGNEGTIAIRWWDGKRYRLTVGYVGENGIKPNTFYHCDESGALVEVET